MKGTHLIVWTLAAALSLTSCAVREGEVDASPSLSPSAPIASEAPASVPFSLPVYSNISLHPVQCANRTNLTLLPLMYEGLFELDSTFTPQPVLCESWQVDETGTVWTFRLRGGVTFSDGTLLSAEQAAASLEAARAPESRYAGRLSQVQSISAQDGQLVVTLNTPNGNLPSLLDIPIYLEQEGRCYGTGPYVLSGSEDAPVLEGRPDWWKGQTLPCARIPLTPISQTEDLIHSFDTREIGLVLTDFTGTAALGYSATCETWDYPTTTMLYLIFNTRSGHCDDRTLRLGMARGIDRASITNSLFARKMSAALLPVSPASPLYQEKLGQGLDYSVSEMDRLLGEATQTRSLTLLVNSENSFKTATAQFLSDQWRSAGLEVQVESLAWEDYLAALAQGRFDLCLAEVSLTADFDLTALLSSGGELNYGGWSSGTTDALLTAFRLARSGEESISVAGNLYAHLAEQVPLVPIGFKNHSVLTQWQTVTGLTPTQNNPFYGMTWSLTQ